MSVGKGTMSGTGWTQNSNRKWVLTTTKGTIKPEAAFFIDKKFTKVVGNAGLSFKYLGAATQTKTTAKTKTSAKYKTGDYKIVEDVNVRRTPNTLLPKLKFKEFTANAQKAIKKLTHNKEVNYFPAGIEITVSQVSGEWGKCPSGWVNLKYCKKI